MDQGVWKESKWNDVNKEDVGSYNRFKEGICTEEREILFFVQRKKRGSKGVYSGTNK